MQQLIEEQAFRIASAVFRFSASLGDTALAHGFQTAAVRLVDATSAGDFASARIALSSIRSMGRLGVEVGIVKTGENAILVSALDSHEKNVALVQKEKETIRFSLED